MTVRGERGPERGDPAGAIVVIGCGALLLVLIAAGATTYLLLAPRSAPPGPPTPMPVSMTPPSLSPVLPSAPSSSPVIPPDPVAAEGMPREVISRVIRAHLAQVRQCYERARATDPTLAAHIELHLTIAADGTVSSATADGSPRTDLTDCIVARARSWRFPASEGGATTVEYPIVFSAAE